MSHKETGQIVPLILLVILVGATLGFSIAGTSIKNLQETSLTEESERAYSAAEAGIEDKLLEIEQTGSATEVAIPTPLSSGSSIKEITVETPEQLELSNLAKDEVAQVILFGGGSGDIKIHWDPNTSLVLTRISGTSDPYTVERQALNCQHDPGNNFSTASYDSGTGRCYYVWANIDGTNDQLLRIKAMYAATFLLVENVDAGVLPVQGIHLTSTGQSGETERTVEVERTSPVPPSILDYVLFSSQGSLSK